MIISDVQLRSSDSSDLAYDAEGLRRILATGRTGRGLLMSESSMAEVSAMLRQIESEMERRQRPKSDAT